MKSKIGFGGGCHWCTEGVFSVLKGVEKVEQGWIKSTEPYNTDSEAVIVYFDPKIVSLAHLIKVHLETHSSTANHSMRSKYRSAIYYFREEDKETCQALLKEYSDTDSKNYITLVLPFVNFKINQEQFLEYFKKNKNAPFCKTYIIPKIDHIKKNFPAILLEEKNAEQQ
jgi:peptide-methionine (S)-S-oxide reductase